MICSTLLFCRYAKTLFVRCQNPPGTPAPETSKKGGLLDGGRGGLEACYRAQSSTGSHSSSSSEKCGRNTESTDENSSSITPGVSTTQQ